MNLKRSAVILAAVIVCSLVTWGTFLAASPRVPLSKYVPAGPVLYLEAKDFSSLLADWNASPQKRQWVRSDSYEVFSRSRLFLRLKGAGDQFAAAAGLPPNMNFLTQIAGRNSALAIYDIGKMQFLYITDLPSARSMQTTLWQTRAKFEPRNVGGADFYVRKDPESQREVAFAVSGEYLLLATREDLLAGALQLISGKQDRSVEAEPWWTQSTSAAGEPGDLRLVLDMQSLVPNGYFRTYWVQQNITDLSQYSAAVSDLYRSGRQYREERVLIRKNEPEHDVTAEAMAAAAELSRLVPQDAGIYETTAAPTAESSFALLETKLLTPHLGPAPVSQVAPQVTLTSGEQGSSSDLETRIDQAPSAASTSRVAGWEFLTLLQKTNVLASLGVQKTERDRAGVFVRIHSAVALLADSDWSTNDVHTATSEFIKPALTAGALGTDWIQKSGYEQLDGAWPLNVCVRGKYLIVSDDSALLESMVANFSKTAGRKPVQFAGGFNHAREQSNFVRFASLVDRPLSQSGSGSGSEPPFFAGNMASLSAALADVSSEKIEVRSEGKKIRQSVIYEWSQ